MNTAAHTSSLRKFVLGTALAALLLAVGCKPKAAMSASAGGGDGKGLTEKQRLDFEQLYFNASKEKMLGNYDLAANLYSQAQRIDPSNAAVYYELANIYNYQRNRDMALVYARKAAELEPRNTWFQVLYADCLTDKKLYKEAVGVYQKLVKMHPERIDMLYDLANACIYANDLNGALKTYDKIEDLAGVREDISMQKIKVYKEQNNFDKCLAEVKKLIVSNPKEAKYYGMLGELYQSKGMNDKAFEAYNDILKVDPNNPYVHLSLADYYRTIKEDDKSYQEVKLAFNNPELDIDTKVSILLSYYKLSETDPKLQQQSLELCKITTDVHPTEAKSFSVYGDFLQRDKKLKEALEQYKKAIALDREKYVIWSMVLFLESDLRDFKGLEADSKTAMELFPTQPLPYLMNGVANMEMKKYEEAISAFKEGKAYVIEDRMLIAQFYSYLGECYNRVKKHAESDDAYDRSLEADPDNANVLNNYSYYLSLRNEKLEKAEKMSKRSNMLEPNISSYQDTYGWILYQMKKYGDARTWIEKAVNSGGGKNNPVILEHLGDACYQLGDKENALKYWNDAKQNGGTSENLEKKIADKKLYE